MENVRQLLIKTGQKFVLNYESRYGYAYFKSKRNPTASKYELIFDEIDGYLVVCNGKKQAVFENKKPVKFY